MINKMNMEEKRKIDKLIVADIDSAIVSYEARRDDERKFLEKKLLGDVLIKAAADALKRGVELQEQGEKQLRSLGLRVGYNGRLDFIDEDDEDSNITAHKDIKAFEQATEAVKEHITQLKKTFALKLFAGNAEAQELFETLARELAKLGAR